MKKNKNQSSFHTKISLFYLIKKFPFFFLAHYGFAYLSAFGVSKIIDYAVKAFKQNSTELIRKEFWLILAGLSLYGLVAYCHIAFGIYCEEVFSTHLRKKLAQKFLSANFSQTQKEKFILTRYDSDAYKVGTLASRIYNRSFFALVSIIITIYMLAKSPKLEWTIPWCLGFLAIMGIITIILYWLAYRYHLKKNKRIQTEDKHFKELSDNVEYIKTMGTEKEEIKKHNFLLDNNLKKNSSFVLIKSIYATIPSYLLRHGIPLVFLYLYKGLEGAILYNWINQVFGNAKTIVEMFWAHGGYDTYCASLKQLNNAFSDLEKNSSFSASPLKSLTIKKANITFQKVDFVYPETKKKILSNFSFTFQHGKKYAIFGTNGIGKSTLFRLIVKLYQPQKGIIKINETEIRKVDNFVLGKKIIYLTSNPYFFNTSLGNNITYPDKYQEGTHKKKLDNIAEKLGIAEFINKLPNKWEATVAEKGQNLSAGQKQLISLIRAFFWDYKVYLFDEFLSNISGSLKEKILPIIFRELQGKTLIIVSHDKEIWQYVDEVYKFTPSKLEEQKF